MSPLSAKALILAWLAFTLVLCNAALTYGFYKGMMYKAPETFSQGVYRMNREYLMQNPKLAKVMR